MEHPVILLASASPRRAELLRQLGLPFAVCPADVEETIPPGISPRDAVMELSRKKALAVAEKALPGQVILAADTVVVLEGRILGKPADAAEARAMLRALSGKEHFVYTGVALLRSGGEILLDYVCTKVHMKALFEAQIAAYVKTGEPMDKAGAYGIQGRAACFVEGIDGCYFNVVGLPLAKIAAMLEQAQVYITNYWE